ncbi:MAG: cadherin domain-containing protein, partial [Sulfurovaceae bacterium]
MNIVSYKISGADSTSFTIDNSGKITVAEGADIDYERSDTYHIKVSAINEAGNESFPVALAINIINEIDTPLHDLVYLVHLSENVPIGTVVGKIEQMREGVAPITSFDILNPGTPFAIDVNGTIRTTGYIDYEQTKKYDLMAVAKTASGNSNKVELQIIITNVDPEVGRPSIEPFSASIDEDIDVGTVVGQLSIDTGGSAVELIALSGTGHSNFIVNTNGVIVIAEGATLDYEQKSSYALEAVAHNANGSSDLVAVNISLNNVADEVPSLLSFTKSVEENATAGTIIGTLRFANNGEGSITGYTLSGTRSEDFSVDTNGTISVASSANLDYETMPYYSLQATALSDIGESEPTSVDIYVLNIAENKPTLQPMILSIEENATIGTKIGQIEEGIGGDSPIISYELTGSSIFKVDGNGNILVNGSVDYEETKQYTLQATATNVVGTSDSIDIVINVTNVVDDEPALGNASFNITENTPIGTVVGTVPIESEGTSAITSINLSGIGTEKFSIDSNGVIKTAQEIDYESKTVYHLQAVATNDKADSAEVAIDIQIENVPEHVPVLYAFKGFVEDNTTAETVVGKVAFAYEGDSPTSAFALSGTGKENFTIDANGTIRVSATASLDENIQKTYSLQVSASNESGSSDLVEAIIVLTHDKTIPYRPSNLKIVDIGHNSITLSWVDNADNERGFNLYQDGVKVATLSPDVAMYRVTGLEEDTSYLFSLKSFNDRGESTGVSIEAITDIDRTEYFKATLKQKCGISDNTFDTYFSPDTGYYASSIDCRNRGLTDDDLLNFKALKSVKYHLYLDRNNFTNVDGLSNLKSVGNNLYLYSNQLTNVDGLGALETVGGELRLNENQLTNVNGLSSLKSVGSHLYLNSNNLTNVNGLSSLTSVGGALSLQDNQITNVDGLSVLKTVGSHLYLQRNQLININGLSALSKVDGDFNLEHNQLTNLDSLTNLTTLGGYLALRGNDNLVDISGAKNIIGSYGKLFYINPDQYTQKADANSSMCSATWDLRSPDANIPDDMSQVCEGQEAYVAEPREELRDTLENKCGISVTTFYTYFNTGYYASSIDCRNRGLTDDDLLNFKALKSVHGYFYLYGNNLTNVDGLSNLKSVGNNLYLYSNQLTNVDGLGALETVGRELRLDENQLTNVNGLSSLKSVGSHLYLNSNQLTNVNGLSSLISVGGNLSVSNNQLTNVDGLVNLTTLGGYLSLQNNPSLTDISGISNIIGSDGQLLYVAPEQYDVKA